MTNLPLNYGAEMFNATVSKKVSWNNNRVIRRGESKRSRIVNWIESTSQRGISNADEETARVFMSMYGINDDDITLGMWKALEACGKKISEERSRYGHRMFIRWCSKVNVSEFAKPRFSSATAKASTRVQLKSVLVNGMVQHDGMVVCE